MATREELSAVKQRHSRQVMGLRGVCGFGVVQESGQEPVLTVHLDASDPEAGAGVPETIEGHPVKRVRSGPFLPQRVAMTTAKPARGKQRVPAKSRRVKAD